MCYVVLEHITKWIDEGSPVNMIYLDLRKLSTKCTFKDDYLD